MPLQADLIQISTSAAPVCGGQGAQMTSVKRAAVETINRGFDKFIIVKAGSQNNVRVVGFTPGTADTQSFLSLSRSGNSVYGVGNSTTSYNPGMPIMGGTHDQEIVIQMFKANDPGGKNAISARDTLGPNWPELIKQDSVGVC
jgi:hypothetical protein